MLRQPPLDALGQDGNGLWRAQVAQWSPQHAVVHVQEASERNETR